MSPVPMKRSSHGNNVAKCNSKMKSTGRMSDKLTKVFNHMLSPVEDRTGYISNFFNTTCRVRKPKNFLEVLDSSLCTCLSKVTPVLASNLFCLLKLVDAGCKNTGDGSYFDAVWLKFLSIPLSPGLHRKVLGVLPKKVMPLFNNPLLLTDFLLTSYTSSGPELGVLALQGVFVLIQKHNLEYPNFYTKLYSLLQPNVLRCSHVSLFFRLLNTSLSSEYLPEYLVAAFVKRLSRLTLSAPAPTQKSIIKLVCSLLSRHPGLRSMCADPRGATDVCSDPYDAEEPDPASCGCTESYLWEMASLRRHLLPEVSRAAASVGRSHSKLDGPLSDLFGCNYLELMEKEFNRKETNVALTFERPQGILMCPEDRFSEFWTL